MRKSSSYRQGSSRSREWTNTRLRILQPVREARGSLHIALFGSVARGDDVLELDIDIIVEDSPEHRIDLFELMESHELLERQPGRRVDRRNAREPATRKT
jgi:predicted nucleotidyltransferase